MFSKTNPKIALITGIVAVLGLFYPLMVLFNFISTWDKGIFRYINTFLPNLGLEYFLQNVFTIYKGRYALNQLDLYAYVILSLGLIAYLVSRGREVRLIRMIFGIILLTKILTFLYVVILLLSSKNIFGGNIILGVLFFLSTLVWIYLSFFLLKKLSANKNLVEKARPEKMDTIAAELLETPKIQRFAHVVIDSFLSIIIFSRYLTPWFKNWQGELMGRIALLLVITISGLVYYVFFEAIFGATPAKFLTESRIVKRKEGTKIKLTNALLRNLIRYVPFEALSYLGNGDGWHDKWANTSVVKEERHGIKAKYYLWLIPIFLITALLLEMGADAKRKSDREKSQQARYDRKVERIIEYTQNLPTTHFIHIKSIDYGGGDYVLKAEEVTDDSVSFSYFTKDLSLNDGRSMETYYNADRERIQVTKISRAALSNSYTTNFKDFEKRKQYGIKFLPSDDEFVLSDAKYGIIEIYPAGAPYISLRKSGGYNGSKINIDLINDGWEANLIAIDNIEGDLKWSNSLPQKLQYILTLRANNHKPETPYKFTFTIVDSLNREKKYLIEGLDNERSIEEL